MIANIAARLARNAMKPAEFQKLSLLLLLLLLWHVKLPLSRRSQS